MRPPGCEFIGSLGDQVFICRHCAAYPDECGDGWCCCEPKTPSDGEP